MFTYRRPNEISSTAGESFVAEGPTNEILDVYVSKKILSSLENVVVAGLPPLRKQTLQTLKVLEIYFKAVD